MRLAICCICFLYIQLCLAQDLQFIPKKQLTLRNIYSSAQNANREGSISINGQKRIELGEIDYALMGFDLGFSTTVAPSTMVVFRLGAISRNSNRLIFRSTFRGNGFDELNYSYQIITPYVQFGLLHFYHTTEKFRASVGAEIPFELTLRKDELVRKLYNSARELDAERVELEKNPIRFASGLEINHRAYYEILDRISVGLELGLQLRYIFQNGDRQIERTFFDGSGKELFSVQYSTREQSQGFHTRPVIRLGLQYSWE